MDISCREQIISEDYADLIVEYYDGIQSIESEFQSNCINVIDRKHAVVHIPVSRLDRETMVKFGYSVFPNCHGLDVISSLEASGINQIRNIPDFNYTGDQVVIGIIDTGIDYTHPAFINADGTTKILSIWDQTIQSDNYPKNLFYGTEYTREEINRALQSEDPFSIVPSKDEIGHGTAVAGIAAGTPSHMDDFSGIAPNATLVIVKVKPAKNYLKDYFVIPREVDCYQENDIMFGINYVTGVAQRENKPIVLCVAMGTNQGGHAGYGPLSDYLSFVGDILGVAVIVSAGNERGLAHHFFSSIDERDGYATMEVNVGENEYGFSMEIWGEAPNTYAIDILSPTGEYVAKIPARIGENREISFVFERTTIEIDYIIVESFSGDQLILVKCRNPTSGIWRFRVYGTGDIDLEFHAWLPMKGFILESTQFIASNPDTTITAPGAAEIPITVTAYDHRTNVIYGNASRGYTREERIKPELAAPGVNLVAPDLNHGYAFFSGTSMAAAHLTGIAALMMEWGIVKKNYLLMDTIEVKKLLIRGARRLPSNTYPNKDWGYGSINLYSSFESLRSDGEIT